MAIGVIMLLLSECIFAQHLVQFVIDMCLTSFQYSYYYTEVSEFAC